MTGVENKELIKVMWLPEEEEILFYMNNERPVSILSELYSSLSKYIDLKTWQNSYSKAYHEWLNKDGDQIYDIKNTLNFKMIKAIENINKELEKEMIFYWFDIDRTHNENFQWEACPLCQKRLVDLGKEYFKTNALISPDFPLVFPALAGTSL